jgi:hypothetical protein
VEILKMWQEYQFFSLAYTSSYAVSQHLTPNHLFRRGSGLIFSISATLVIPRAGNFKEFSALLVAQKGTLNECNGNK